MVLLQPFSWFWFSLYVGSQMRDLCSPFSLISHSCLILSICYHSFTLYYSTLLLLAARSVALSLGFHSILVPTSILVFFLNSNLIGGRLLYLLKKDKLREGVSLLVLQLSLPHLAFPFVFTCFIGQNSTGLSKKCHEISRKLPVHSQSFFFLRPPSPVFDQFPGNKLLYEDAQGSW